MRSLLSALGLARPDPALTRAVARAPALAGFVPRRLLKDGPAAVVYLGRFDDRPAVLKVFLGPEAALMARRQADALAASAMHLAAGPWRVAPLLLSAPEAGAVVTGHVEGTRLDAELVGADADRRARLLAAAGSWHVALTSERSAGVFQARYWLRMFGTGLAAIEGPAVPLARALADRLAAMAEVVHGQPVTRARGHGDFGTQNLIRGDGALWGIDLGAVAPGPVLKEVARFVVNAAMHAPMPGGPPGIAPADAAVMLAVPGMPPAAEAARLMPFMTGLELAERLVRSRPGSLRAARAAAAVEAYLAASTPPP